MLKLKDTSAMVLIMLVLGTLLIMFKGGIVSLAVITLGAVVGALGLIDLFQEIWLYGGIKFVLGIGVILLAWFCTNIVLYILAALIILWGLYQLYLVFKAERKEPIDTVMAFALPVLSIVAGILMIINSPVLFLVCGILIILEAIMILVNQYILQK